MRYRSKSAARVLSELAELSDRYGLRNVQFVDNILDMSHIKTVLGELAEVEPGYSLFDETKANLKRPQVRALARAGVGWIQPRIKSLDDRVLRLIGKGNSALMNLQLSDGRWNAVFRPPGTSSRASPARATTGTARWPSGCLRYSTSNRPRA